MSQKKQRPGRSDCGSESARREFKKHSDKKKGPLKKKRGGTGGGHPGQTKLGNRFVGGMVGAGGGRRGATNSKKGKGGGEPNPWEKCGGVYKEGENP